MESAFEYELTDLNEKGLNWKKNQLHDNWGYTGAISAFDKLLTIKWNEVMKAGAFKYGLDNCQYKVLHHDFMPFVAQLNVQRGFNRRKHELFDHMNAPFADEQFNFTKIKSKEKLLTLRPGKSTALGRLFTDVSSRKDHVVAINISPIDACHVLLIPELDSCLAQRITLTSLLLAFDFVQLSAHPGFRVGFNSLHAWASINHLHFHAMYFDYPLFLDNHPANTNLSSDCYLLDESVMPGFLFNVSSPIEKRIEVAKEAVAVIDLLHARSIPYNVMVTRGESGTRMVVIPRRSTKDRDRSTCFDVACVEIGGHLPVKTEEEFNDLTHVKARSHLANECLDEEDFVSLSKEVEEKLQRR